MAFTIPDNDEALAANPQSIWMQTDIDALVSGAGGSGVISGGAVTAQGTPDMTVAVSAGEALLGTTLITITSGNVTVGAADSTNPRVDLIRVDNTGTKGITSGTAAANPKAPALPANNVLLAMVYVPANDTAIASDQIIDKRVVLQRRLYEAICGTTGYNPVDGETVYLGVIPSAAPASTTGLVSLYFQHAGRIIAARVQNLVAGTLGSTGSSTFSVRLNNTTDYQISNAVTHTAVSATFVNTSMNVPVAAGDFIDIKVAHPTWTTNPTSVFYIVTLMVEVYG